MARKICDLRLLEVPPVEYFDSASESEENVILSDFSYQETDVGSSDDDNVNPARQEETQAEAEMSTPRPSRTRKRVKEKNKYKSNLRAPKQRGDGSLSTKIHLPQGKNGAERVTRPIDAWSLLFNDEILEIILKQTNEQIVRSRTATEYRDADKTYSFLTMMEFRAFIGLLYFAGASKNNSDTAEMWSNLGSPIYRATMSQNRFKFILSCLRFDDQRTRRERRTDDKFAPIRDIWERFVENCKNYYSPHQICTINEQLVSFCGRCAFKVYIRNKPHKCGIKLVTINDSATSYMFNAIPYVGKMTTEANEPVSFYCIRKLSEPIYNTGRKVICDKRGTAIFDQLCDDYSTARATRRWPLRIFFAMLDYAIVNSFVLYQLNIENESLIRFKYVQNLTMALLTPFVQQRMQTQTLRKNLKLLINHIFGIEMPITMQYDPVDCKLEKRKRCVFCNVDRKTQYICCTCKRPRCEEHRSYECIECAVQQKNIFF
ncbi:uncharacterized protein LOC109857612 isoform X2 [Pseudomyrmex gracilis]|nr:uncharacterized protein LOC109857612 isoform X2 [Pseudomyrmex gracilis]